MPSLSVLAKAVHEIGAKNARHNSWLVYGDPKSGKTRLLATLAKVPEVRSIWWFDTENGSETLTGMVREGVLTEEEAAKVTIIKMVDLPESAVAMDTILKCLVDHKKQPQKICDTHGRVNCPECLKVTGATWTVFDVTKLTAQDWVVVDTVSQFGISCMNYATKGWGYDTKPGFDEYGMTGRMNGDLGTVLQAAPYCNYAVTAHQLMFEDKDTEKRMGDDARLNEKFGKVYPMWGTKNFSVLCGKFFDTVFFLEKKVRTHSGGSSSTYKADTITGSRTGIALEKAAALDMRYVFHQLGMTAWVPPAPAVQAGLTKK